MGMVLILIFGEVLGLYGQVMFIELWHMECRANRVAD